MALFADHDSGAGYHPGRRLANVLKTIAANLAKLEPSAGVKSSAAANYSLVLADRYVRGTKADAAQTVTVPTNATVAFEIGTVIRVEATTAQVLTIAAAGGVTIRQLAAKTLAIAGQYGVATLVKVAANEWTVSGDLAAA